MSRRVLVGYVNCECIVNMADRFDLLLLGATGFTGRYAIPYLHRFCQSNNHNLTWGVAGRSKTKLEQTMKDVGNEIGVDLLNIPIIIVDIGDQHSLERMANSAKVVINCCGPFRFLGEPVVKACIEAGTHHVDISAEPQFMEKLELELKEEARRKGVYVVTACGFDCICADLGVVFLQQQFKGTLNSITMFMEPWMEEEGRTRSIIGYNSNSIISAGTWDSVIPVVANWKEIAQNHKKLFPPKMSEYQPEVKQKYLPHRNEVVDAWCIPLPTADSSSIRRTQKYFMEEEGKRPSQINTYYATKTFCEVVLISTFIFILYLLSKFKLGQSFLAEYPGLFTLGMFRKKPPPEKVVRNTHYQMTFHGEGWEDQVGPDDVQYHKACDKHVLGRVKGRNGYELTSIGVILSAITIIEEKEQLPKGGGVFSAGACFAKTSLIKKLNQEGVKFEILYEKKI